MNDALTMRLVERAPDLDGVAKGLVERYRSLRQTAPKRLAFQILHHEEVDARLQPDVMEDTDVSVFERRHRLRLAQEALAKAGVSFRWAGRTLTATVRLSRTSRAL